MKIAYTSDITMNNRLLIPHLVNRIKEIGPDVFVIAGDVCN
jgi:Icc-related predicted phosphoesterase